MFLQPSQKPKIHFTIKGKVLNADRSTTIKFTGDRSYETKFNPDKTFEIKGTTSSPGTMLVHTDKSYISTFFASEGEINLTLEELPNSDTTKRRYLKITDVSGAPETVADYKLGQRFDELQAKYKEFPKESKVDSFNNAMYAELKNYIAANPKSWLAPSLLYKYQFLKNEQKKELLTLIDKNVNPLTIAGIEKEIRRDELLKPGTVIPDFTQKDINGSAFSLHSVKADYILLEFWASWCLGCRQDNPGLVKVYEKYHPNGFEIVGISIEEKKKDWEKAVAKDKLPWIHLLDLKGKNIADNYDISGIPFNILLNSRYEVVAINLRSQGLDNKLKALLPITP